MTNDFTLHRQLFNFNLMSTLFDFGSFIIQAINFMIVAYVLRRFFFVPYLKFLDGETKKRKELEEQLAKSSHVLEDAHNQAANLVDQAKFDARITATEILENARKESSEILTKAHSDADIARSKGFADVVHERKVMADDLRTKVLDIALKLNAKIFGANAQDHREFLTAQTKDITLS